MIQIFKGSCSQKQDLFCSFVVNGFDIECCRDDVLL